MLSRGKLEFVKTCIGIFCMLPRHLEYMLDCESLVFSVKAGTKTALDVLQLWFNCYAGSLFKALDMRFPRCTKQTCPVVGTLSTYRGHEIITNGFSFFPLINAEYLFLQRFFHFIRAR